MKFLSIRVLHLSRKSTFTSESKQLFLTTLIKLSSSLPKTILFFYDHFDQASDNDISIKKLSSLAIEITILCSFCQ